MHCPNTLFRPLYNWDPPHSLCPTNAYRVSCAWAYYLTTFEKLLFHDPSCDFRRKRYANLKQYPDIVTKYGWRNFIWAVSLFILPRGDRWMYEVKSTTKIQPGNKRYSSRRAFIHQWTLKLIRLCLLGDAVNVWCHYSGVFKSVCIPDEEGEYKSMAGYQTVWSFINTMGAAILVYRKIGRSRSGIGFWTEGAYDALPF
jgi:hypothetical protein